MKNEPCTIGKVRTAPWVLIASLLLWAHIAMGAVPTAMQAKRVTLHGRVTDTAKAPVIGASVVVVGSTAGSITDMEGNFSLTVEALPVKLQVSYIGYKTLQITVTDTRTVQAVLREEAETLEEVVVVGYGTQKKVDLTGSVASVGTDAIKERVQTDVMATLQGLVPGVTVINRPGSDVSINFRGRGNLGTSEPLYVIDGVIATATLFSELDPNSIESVSFLKDAASASIYGSRAAYGVVLVTTKQGKKEKMNVTYSGYVSLNNPTYLLDFVNSDDYALLYNEALYNANPAGGKYQGYTEEEIGWFRDGSKPDLYPNTRWNDLLGKNVVTTQHSIGVNGGSERVRYYAGLGYTYKNKYIPGQDMNRYNLNLNVAADVTRWLTVKTNVKFIQRLDDRNCGALSIGTFQTVPSTFVAKQSNGEWGTVNGGKIAETRLINYNPLRGLSTGDWGKTKDENTIYDLGFDIKPIKGLVISGEGSYRMDEYKNKSYTALQDNVHNFFSGEEITGTGNETNYMSVSWLSYSTMLYTATAKYDWSKTIHNLSVLAGTSYEHYKYEQLYAQRQDFPGDGFTDISAGASTGPRYLNGGSMSEYKMLSYFGRVNYSLMGRYLFEANLRADASSRFHKDHRWGWFPSFSVGWRMSEEPFLKNVTWIDNLKLRASYGTLGNINNVGYYDYFQTYTSWTHYTFSDEDVMGMKENKPANTSLGWEKVALTDVGVDFTLWGGMLDVTADYYLKKTSDILLEYNVPYETGIIENPSQNFGKVKNSGFELAVNHRHHIGPVKYTVGANIATNRNRVVKMGTSNNMISYASSSIQYILREGHPVGSFFGYKADGLYTQAEIDAGHYYTLSGVVPNAGDTKYVPQRKEVQWGEAITADDRTIIGNDVPSFTYGVKLDVEWKGLELNIFGQGVCGTKVAFDVYGIHPFYQGTDQPRKFHLKRWTEENPNPHAVYPRLYSASSPHFTYNRNFNSSHLFDSDYFRFKTITLAYKLPKPLVTRWGMESLKVFLTGENLFTIRADKAMGDFDPETAGGVIYSMGIKSVALGVNVSL